VKTNAGEAAATKKIKISVCMATFNGKRFLKRQIDSILSQLAPDDELVISDDGSTDATLTILATYSDPRIRLFHASYKSPIFNFENALKHAKGDVICLSDQDDIWLDNKLEVVRDYFMRNRFGCTLIMLDGMVIHEDESLQSESIFKRLGAGTGILKNIFKNTWLGCCLAFSRDLLDIALPFPSRIPMHDMWLGLMAEIHGRVELVAVKTILYRKHSASLTDFRIQFRPLIQIRWRFFLIRHLLIRSCDIWCSGSKTSPVRRDT